ncbi:PREDICTED: protein DETOXIFICATION 16-like [Ipomoea nil]|uniref:protein DETOXIFICATION 16-like n=1 Tax=Ipomoea nil TaxID=35883 RepID=UPI000901378D|nr:PREDICTED: protein DETOXIFICATION 16-like [Ipomoea nil]
MERKAEMEIPLILESENDERRKCWDEVSGEVKKLMVLAGPLISVNLLLTSLQFISLMFAGNRGGELSLSGASMATAFASVTGFSFMRGLAGALDTLCGQSYGAKQYQMLGIFMQRGMLVMLLVCIPVAGVWAYTDRILSLCGQDPEISDAAGEYARFLIPSIFPYAILRCFVSFLQAQNNVVPMMFTVGIAALVHVLSCWVLVFKSGMGFTGAAMANAISYWVNVVLLGVYVRVSPSCKETWTGFSKDMFHDIIKFLRLGIPSTAMLCLENWSFELMVLLCGFLPNPKLETSVLSITLNTCIMVYMLPMGLGGAISVRVSNEVGGGRPNAAWVAVRTALGCAANRRILVGIAMLSLHKVWDCRRFGHWLEDCRGKERHGRTGMEEMNGGAVLTEGIDGGTAVAEVESVAAEEVVVENPEAKRPPEKEKNIEAVALTCLPETPLLDATAIVIAHARGLKKHMKRLNAPKHWILDKFGGAFAPKPSFGPHKG